LAAHTHPVMLQRGVEDRTLDGDVINAQLSFQTLFQCQIREVLCVCRIRLSENCLPRLWSWTALRFAQHHANRVQPLNILCIHLSAIIFDCSPTCACDQLYLGCTSRDSHSLRPKSVVSRRWAHCFLLRLWIKDGGWSPTHLLLLRRLQS
jgi:hypothetical protein